MDYWTVNGMTPMNISSKKQTRARWILLYPGNGTRHRSFLSLVKLGQVPMGLEFYRVVG